MLHKPMAKLGSAGRIGQQVGVKPSVAQVRAQQEATAQSQQLQTKISSTVAKINSGEITSLSQIPADVKKYIDIPANYFTDKAAAVQQQIVYNKQLAEYEAQQQEAAEWAQASQLAGKIQLGKTVRYDPRSSVGKKINVYLDDWALAEARRKGTITTTPTQTYDRFGNVTSINLPSVSETKTVPYNFVGPVRLGTIRESPPIVPYDFIGPVKQGTVREAPPLSQELIQKKKEVDSSTYVGGIQISDPYKIKKEEPFKEDYGIMTVFKEDELKVRDTSIPYFAVDKNISPFEAVELGTVLSTVPSYLLSSPTKPIKKFKFRDIWEGVSLGFINKPSGELTPSGVFYGSQRDIDVSGGNVLNFPRIKTADKLANFLVGNVRTATEVRHAENLYQWKKSQRDSD